MSNLEKINHELSELKTCPAEDAARLFGSLAVSFTRLTKSEQNEFAQQFYTWADKARKSSRKQQPKFRYAKFLMGLNYLLSDQHELALKELNEARDLFEEQQDKEGVAICLVPISGVYRTLGDFDLSLKISWEAYEQLKSSTNFIHLNLACLMNMANIYLEMQNNDEALHMFKMAQESSEKAGNIYWLNYSLQGLGKAYLQEKKYAEAKDFFEQALALSEKNNSPLGIANSLTELANYYFKVGDLAEAEKLNQRAIVIREEHHYTGGAVTNYIRLGEVYMKESKLDEALSILTKGLEVAEQIKVKPKIYQIHFMLSEIFQKKNEPEKSLEHYKMFHAVRDQVEVEDSERKLKNAKLIFEAEQTKKENVIIKKQKAEIERKNVELQHTIDELTRARVGKRARAFTLAIAIFLFIVDDYILGSALHLLPTDNYFASLAVKMIIIFSLRPINGAIEKFLMKKVLRERQKNKEAVKEGETVSANEAQAA